MDCVRTPRFYLSGLSHVHAPPTDGGGAAMQDAGLPTGSPLALLLLLLKDALSFLI